MAMWVVALFTFLLPASAAPNYGYGSTYGSPSPSYGSSSSSYGSPSSSYGSRSSYYGSPSSSYGSPSSSYGSPGSSHGSPTSSYGSPTSSYGSVSYSGYGNSYTWPHYTKLGYGYGWYPWHTAPYGGYGSSRGYRSSGGYGSYGSHGSDSSYYGTVTGVYRGGFSYTDQSKKPEAEKYEPETHKLEENKAEADELGDDQPENIGLSEAVSLSFDQDYDAEKSGENYQTKEPTGSTIPMGPTGPTGPPAPVWSTEPVVDLAVRWVSEQALAILLPSNSSDLIALSPLGSVPCLYSGSLLTDPASFVTVSGCQGEPTSITIASARLQGGLVDLVLTDGVTEIIQVDVGAHEGEPITVAPLEEEEDEASEDAALKVEASEDAA